MIAMRWVVGVIAAGTALVGCDDDDRRRPYESGVDGGTAPVADLSDDELRQICSSFDGYVNTYVDLSTVAYAACLPLSIVSSLDSETCEYNLDQCVQRFPKPVTVVARSQSDEVCFDNLKDCQATVAQLEGCVNVNVNVVLDILENISCLRAADPEYREMVRPMTELTTVCADINAACNQFADVQAPD